MLPLRMHLAAAPERGSDPSRRGTTVQPLLVMIRRTRQRGPGCGPRWGVGCATGRWVAHLALISLVQGFAEAGADVVQ